MAQNQSFRSVRCGTPKPVNDFVTNRLERKATPPLVTGEGRIILFDRSCQRRLSIAERFSQ